MKTVFLGERDLVHSGSIVMGANAYSPPDESVDTYEYFGNRKARSQVGSWLEVWDYAGSSSFRGFVAGSGSNKCLFAFFDDATVGRELKQGLMALIELAETTFGCPQVVICLDRSMEEDEARNLMKSLRWVGFELATLDAWAGELDVTSKKWLFLGMEV